MIAAVYIIFLILYLLAS